MHNGSSLKALINEKFGDGIMSAIDFYMTVDKKVGVENGAIFRVLRVARMHGPQGIIGIINHVGDEWYHALRGKASVRVKHSRACISKHMIARFRCVACWVCGMWPHCEGHQLTACGTIFCLYNILCRWDNAQHAEAWRKMITKQRLKTLAQVHSTCDAGHLVIAWMAVDWHWHCLCLSHSSICHV